MAANDLASFSFGIMNLIPSNIQGTINVFNKSIDSLKVTVTGIPTAANLAQKSISELEAAIKQLEKERNEVTDITGLAQYNDEILRTKKRLAALNDVGTGDTAWRRYNQPMQFLNRLGNAAGNVKKGVSSGVNGVVSGIGSLIAGVSSVSGKIKLAVALAKPIIQAGEARGASVPVIDGGLQSVALKGPAETFDGKLKTMTDNLTDYGGRLGLALTPFTDNVMSGISKIIEKIPDILTMLQPVIDMLNSIDVAGMLDEGVTFIKGIIEALKPAFTELQPLFYSIWNFIQGIGSSLKTNILDLLKNIGPGITILAHLLSATLGPILDITVFLFDKLLVIVSSLIEALDYFLKPLMLFLSELVDVGKAIYNGEDPMQVIHNYQPAYTSGKLPTEPKGSGDPKDSMGFIKQLDSLGMGTNLSKADKPFSLLQPSGTFASLPANKTNQTSTPAPAKKQSDSITSGGLRTITFNIDTLGIKGGLTVNAQDVKEGASQLGDIVVEELIRALDSVGGAMAN